MKIEKFINKEGLLESMKTQRYGNLMYWTQPQQIFLDEIFVQYPADKVAEFETMLRPGKESAGKRRYSRDGFMGEQETISGIIADDRRILQQYGVTHRQIADKLDSLLGRWGTSGFLNDRSHIPPSSSFEPYQCPEDIGVKFGLEGPVIDNTFAVSLALLHPGPQSCPFEYFMEDDVRNHKRCGVGMGVGCIENIRTGEVLQVHDLLPHLIGDHHFFEGRGTPYGLDPEKAIRLLEIEPGVDYAPKIVYDLFWRDFDPWYERDAAEYLRLCETLLPAPSTRVPKLPGWSLAIREEDGKFKELLNFSHLNVHEEGELAVVEIPELRGLRFGEAILNFPPALEGALLHHDLREEPLINRKFLPPQIHFFDNFLGQKNPYESAAVFYLTKTLYHVG